MRFFTAPLLLSLLGLGLCAGASLAATTANEMIDISAQESLEWYQDTRLYVARGQAKAVKGETVIEADLLTAHGRAKTGEENDKTAASAPQGDIDRLTAEGNVRIYDPKQKVTGEKAVYDVDTGVMLITGSNLKYTTETDTVTAKDSLEYYEKKNMAVARGHAMGVHNDTRVQADVLTAFFDKNAQGQMAMKELHAKGRVVIVTKEGDVSRGDQAIYRTQDDVAVLTGHVGITRGETQLAGDRAEVNFKTGQSRLINDGSGRVRALLPSPSGKKGAP